MSQTMVSTICIPKKVATRESLRLGLDGYVLDLGELHVSPRIIRKRVFQLAVELNIPVSGQVVILLVASKRRITATLDSVTIKTLEKNCMIEVRSETTADHEAVRKLTIAAFESSEFGHNGEADLVDLIRDAEAGILSLVACRDEEVVGHILFSPVNIVAGSGEICGMGLGPMSVEPVLQRSGIGSLLVQKGIEELFGDDIPFVVVLGHPGYYPRFGFCPAAGSLIYHGFEGIPQDVFFIRYRHDDARKAVDDGHAYFLKEFGPQFIGETNK